MTQVVDIVNRALQVVGTRTTVTAGELAGNLTNEAIQANLVINNIRRKLLRMAPWDCAVKNANLVYITSAPGTPENTSAATTLWQPGQPSPPWAYEYQYPVDCVRACYIIPSTQTGFAGGIPISIAVTGGAAGMWNGPPIRFKVQTDTFVPVTAATVALGGTGYAIGDFIYLPSGPNTSPPIGAPAVLQVTGVAAGVITSVAVVSQLPGGDETAGGSYFGIQSNPVSQATTSGSGTGASFNLTQGNPAPQRVILTNQEFAMLSYCQDVVDPNVMDDMFQDAWVKVLGATLALALTGDKKIANGAIGAANQMIEQARTADGNEGLTVNDHTPDWIRTRGFELGAQYSGPFTGVDWGASWGNF